VAIKAAMTRKTVSGQEIGSAQAVTAAQALCAYLSHWDNPGGPSRRIEVGQPADIVVMDSSWDVVLAEPSSEHVAMTVIGGQIAFAG
jgi:predicted amidohydrolase YtcJ